MDLPKIKQEIFLGLQGSFEDRQEFGRVLLLELAETQPPLLMLIRSAIDKYNAEDPTWVNGLIFGVCTAYAAFSRQAACDELEDEPIAKEKTKKIELTCCRQCPNHHSEQGFSTGDSFDCEFVWWCELLGRENLVRQAVDWHDHTQFIPTDCPLKDA